MGKWRGVWNRGLWVWALMAAAWTVALPVPAVGEAPQRAGMGIATQPLKLALRGAEVSRLRYWTADPLHPHKLIAASALLLLPKSAATPAQGWPVLVWDHGTSGFAVACGPSVEGYTAGEAQFLARWVEAGYAVVAPDYIGMGEPGPNLYLNARSEGVATLDAVRAALQAQPGLRNEIIINGHSQGAQAAIAAAGLAPAYAPELRLRGVIAMAPPYFEPSTVSAQLLPGSGANRDGLLFVMFLAHAWHQAHPGFDPGSLFTPQAAPLLSAAGQRCLRSLSPELSQSGLTLATALTPEARQVLPQILAWAAYPELGLNVPLFIATGSADRTLAPASQLRLARAVCAAHGAVEFHLYPGLNHVSTRDDSQTDAMNFARRQLAGQPFASNCPIPDNLQVE